MNEKPSSLAAGGYPQGPGYPPVPGYPPPLGFAYPQVPPPAGAPVTYAPAPAGGYPPPGDGYRPPVVAGTGGYQPPGAGYAPPLPPTGYLSDPHVVPYQTGIPGVPPGLEYLSMVDQLLVHQKKELLEVFLGCETQNKYVIKNSLGQQVYRAKEDTDCCTRNCCGPSRPFDIEILDNAGNEVIHFNRGLRCEYCCCFCCLQRLEVSAPPGTVIGRVVQEWSICTPKYRIENERGECLLRIEGPFLCTCKCCADINFKVLSKDGTTKVGKVSKQWSGLLTESFTDADHFGINFPVDLDVRVKAVLLGALFLIDYMYFEQSGGEGVAGMLSNLT